MPTLADLRTKAARYLRDPGNNTWSVNELDDLINAGIGAVSDLAPREIVQTIGTVSAGVHSYSLGTALSHVYRVNIYAADGTFSGNVPTVIDNADSGWEIHGGVLYLPPGWLPDAGSTVEAWGYGGYIRLSATTTSTDLPDRLIEAVLLYCQVEGYGRLVADRAAFAQWQSDPDNRDATLLGLVQTYNSLRSRWRDEQRALRRMRK